VLNAPTYCTTLAPNDALPDPNFCNQSKIGKLIALTLCQKLSHNSWMPEEAVLPQTHLIRYAPETPDPFLPERVGIKGSSPLT